MTHVNRPNINRQIRVARYAEGIAGPESFALAEAPRPACPDNGFVVKNMLVAVDPAMRGWLTTEANYVAPLPLGSVMRSQAVGEVVESTHLDYRPGDVLVGWFGWQDYCAATAETVTWRCDLDFAPPAAWLNVLGLIGMTALIGFKDLARPRSGEIIVVSTAAGAVGSLVGQLARHSGLRAIGLTGSDDKVARCVAEFGYAAAINYRQAADLQAAVGALCPEGVDIFFDNTAGPIADAVWPHLRRYGRITQCGTSSIARWSDRPAGPRRERDLLTKQLSWNGMIVLQRTERYASGLEELKALYAAGHLRGRDHILEGIEQAPGALQLLYRGDNHGRLAIRL